MNTEGQEVVLLGVTDAAIAILRTEYEVVPDATTEAGYTAVKVAATKIMKLRTSVDRRHKELKAPIIKQGKALDAEKNRVTAALVEIEKPWKDAKQVIDDAAKLKEEERLNRIRGKIDEIRNRPLSLLSAGSEAIGEELEALNQIDLGDFYDLSGDAAAVIAASRSQMNTMMLSAVERESAASQLAEQSAQIETREAAVEVKENMIPGAVAQNSAYSGTSAVNSGFSHSPTAPATIDEWCEKYEITDSAKFELLAIID